MGGGGSKGGAAAPAAPPVKDYSVELMQLQNQMTMMGKQMESFNTPARAAPVAAMPDTPDVEQVQAIDWDAAAKASDEKAAAEYGKAAAKGRMGTILTSPLLDDEDPETTGALLG